MRRSPLRQVSARRRKRDAVYAGRRLEVFDRAEGLCEARAARDCTGACEQVHHKGGRGGPDPHRLSNLLGVCAPCHAWATNNHEQAIRHGVSTPTTTAITPGRWA